MANGRDNNGRFTKGHAFSVGNNGGRKKRTDEEKFMRVLFRVVDEDRLGRILEKLATCAEGGESWACTLLLAYYAGKPVERQELSGTDGGPLALVVRYENPPNTDGDGPA